MTAVSWECTCIEVSISYVRPPFHLSVSLSVLVGDSAVHSCGVIADPEMSLRAIERGDEFLVLATDGLWDYCSNVEVGLVLVRCPGELASCVRELSLEAHSRWVGRVGGVEDDISIIVVQLSSTRC